MAVLTTLSGCAGGYDQAALAPPPPVTDRDYVPYATVAERWHPDIPGSALPARRRAAGIAVAVDTAAAPVPQTATALTEGCSLGDRFDNEETLSYNFNGGRSRIGLKLDMEGPSLSNPARMEVHGAMIRLRHRLQPVSDSKAKCRYDSPWQGFAGSIYNETVLRKDKTIWHELEDRGVDFFR